MFSVMNYTFSNKLANLKPSAIREIFKSLTDPEIIAFAAGNPSAESFPVEFIKNESARIFREEPVTALQYGTTEGYPPLREAVAQRLKNRFGCGKDFDSTVIVSGGQQGIELTCKAFCNEGDVVICENPSFIGALNAFRSNGVRPAGVRVEQDGIDIDELNRVISSEPNAKLLYLIPTFQNPSGITMSAEKRRIVYDIAKKHNLIIIEDNPYGELRFSGEEIPTIKSIDDDGIVVYCGSFSKILSAGIRVGFVQAHSDIISKIVVAKQVEDVHTNMFAQLICNSFMQNFDMDGHISGVRKLYREKCSLMLNTMDSEMPEEVTYTRPEGGLFLWCTFPESVSVPELTERLLDKKVAVVPGTAFNCDTEMPTDSIRLNYSTPSCEQIERGIKILASEVRKML
ncbi:MAG: PLP-dependent aminotransferase family protein [Clostridia bacterium]|nr:PLP-dependent aminotransferase family protein [Clostridia bacterium]